MRDGISKDGEGEGLVSEGVSMSREAVLELDREWDFVFRGFPPNGLLDVLLVIAQQCAIVCDEGKEGIGGVDDFQRVTKTREELMSSSFSIPSKSGKLTGVLSWLGVARLAIILLPGIEVKNTGNGK
jgi:hypothetical protein